MNNEMIIALMPLWIGVAVLLIGLPTGLHFANKERQQRLSRIRYKDLPLV